MTDLDPTNNPQPGHDEAVTSEDRLIRLSKQVAEEIIAVQTRLITLEQREDTPARQHETELLWRQVKTLEAKKSDYEREIAGLQARIRAYRDAQDGPAAEGQPPAQPGVASAGSLLDGIRRKNTERALATSAQLPFWPEAWRGWPRWATGSSSPKRAFCG